MTIDETIRTYLEGWKLGDGKISLPATAESFTYDDPDTGTVQRKDFVEFVSDFRQLAIDMGATGKEHPFLDYSDVVITKNKTETQASVWCWWHAAGTDLQGCALIKASDKGILHEKIAYFSKLP